MSLLSGLVRGWVCCGPVYTVSTRFARFQVVTVKLVSCRLWRHVVWLMGTNVSEKLRFSTPVLFCFSSKNTKQNNTSAVFFDIFFLNHATCFGYTAIIRHTIIKIHKELFFVYCCDYVPDGSRRPKRVAWLSKSKCFYNIAIVFVFINWSLNSDNSAGWP